MADEGSNEIQRYEAAAKPAKRVSYTVALSPKQRTVAQLLCGASLASIAGWCFQNFLQLRGVVDLAASRIFLAMAAAAICVAWLIFTWSRRMFVKAVGVVFIVSMFIGVDRWVPKPKPVLPELSLVCRGESVPVLNPPDASGVVLVDPYFPLGSANRWLIHSAHGYPPDYIKDSAVREIYRCDATNTANILLQDIYLNATVISTRSRGRPPTVICDGTEVVSRKEVAIPIGDLVRDKTAVFFFYNGTNDCAELHFRSATSGKAHVQLKMDFETQELVSLTSYH